jgi:A/G-specific adenine glycosylase
MQFQLGFSENLIKWYQQNKRDLPWRNIHNPYKIWVSEIILQQTRVQQGLPYYERFVTNYPTVSDLANAPIDDVLRLWQGLGYYSRARNMHHAAKYVAFDLKNNFPNTFDALLEMKGVGRYTAAAIASFAFGEKVPVVDGNVQRVLARVFGITDDISSPKTQKIFEKLASEHISVQDPGTFNQAIMEFGAQYCTPAKPDCDKCIFKTICFAYQSNMVSSLPVKLKKTKVRNRYFNYIVFKYGNDLAMRKREEKDIWNGLFEFLLIESDAEINESEMLENLTTKYSVHLKPFKSSETYLHILSHQRLHAKFHIFNVEDRQAVERLGLVFYSNTEIEKLAKPVLIVNYLTQEKIF